MIRDKLYETVKSYGFTIALFTDHQNFFSSWSITVRKNENSYIIEHEGRDNWLIIYCERAPDKLEELDKKISHAMTDDDKIDQCGIWLSAIA
ncbi:hypothetical protein BK658_08320 [Pseudomonas brassicacearum]|uniref:Uncharacterized protein n=1 Tax=Pseudomonas brassicacearum TaxID=930166 RepID=A0A423GUN1_9PSED|nr:hypothetical protein BK658_08320 [Pseudomonas brassicacearum]